MTASLDKTPRATVQPNFRTALVAEMPHLRAFAISLCRSRDLADDLVQDTLVRAWSSHASFQTGTNLKAWLFTILRNSYFSTYRKQRNEVADSDGQIAASVGVPAAQDGAMAMADFHIALAKIPDDQREALLLVGASGFTYEEAAEICGAAVGTIKSRVSRARAQLAKLLGLEIQDDSSAGPNLVEASER